MQTERTPLGMERIVALETRFFERPENRIAMNAVTNAGYLAAATDRRIANTRHHTFSHLIRTPGATNQKQSGRCWLFAGLNLLRLEVRDSLGLDQFELSQTFLMFYDKLEKANFFLSNIADTAGEPADGRLVSWLLADGAADGGADPAPIGAADPQPGPQGPLERTPPPRCEGVDPPPGASASDLVDADVDARGCSVPVAWDGDVLRVPRAEDAPRVYDLDAEVGDQLLFGDWTCDGGDTPALYRAATGELFLFDGFAERDEEVTGRVEETGVADGHPRVLTDDAGCDRVEVEAR